MLKIFTKNAVGQIGNWQSPGGRYKKFISSNSDVILTWNYENGTLSFKGKVGDSLKELFISMFSTKENKGTSCTSSELIPPTINQAVPGVSGLVTDSHVDGVLTESESMKFNIKILESRTDALQSLANVQKIRFNIERIFQ